MAGSGREGERARAKTALRRRMREVRAAIPPGEREARAAAIERAILGLPEFHAARTVFTFLSMDAEVPTWGLVARLQAEGRDVLLPRVVGGRMEAVAWRRGEALERSFYGASEPSSEAFADPAGIDLVLAPGLAFDRRGNRIGYGGAYFDRFLPRLRPDAVRAGICFHEQVVEHVPTDPHDVALDLLVTDLEVIRPGARS